MIIAENPYISEFLLKSAESLQVPMLETSALKNCQSDKFNLNILKEEDSLNYLSKQENPLIYSNSESSFDWIYENLKNSDTIRFISLFKDKFKFRESVKSIYPDFYFEKISYDKLFELDYSKLPSKFIIKPNVGFLSLGVHAVRSEDELKTALEIIKNEISALYSEYSDSVVNLSDFIIEQMIEGEEYAVDAYFTEKSEPVILNIFNHPFFGEEDVSDRIYLTSVDIIKANYDKVLSLLQKIAKNTGLKNFPIHIELRKEKDGRIIPIEINPMRFAGWCTADVANYAYNINVYECFFKQISPDWEKIFAQNDAAIYYFSMPEVPSSIDRKKIKSFNYDAFCKNYSEILELRKVDYKNNPVFAVIFGKTKNEKEIENILNLKTVDFIE